MAIEQIGQVQDSLTAGTGYIDTIASKAIIRPWQVPGISGFLFDIAETDKVEMTADITEQYAEDTSFINDHVVHKPVRVTLTGLIGELVIRQEILSLVAGLQRLTLPIVASFGGQWTDGMAQTVAGVVNTQARVALTANSTANRVRNLVNLFNTDGPFLTSQERAFAQLEALFINKGGNLLSVQTPWRYFDSMLIESMDFTQDPQTAEISNVSVTLKEVRFTQVGIKRFDQVKVINRNQIQEQEAVQGGGAGDGSVLYGGVGSKIEAATGVVGK